MNYFLDYPDRQDSIKKYSDIRNLILPLEETYGEKGFYKSPDEAMEFYERALSEIGKFCAEELRPFAGKVDEEGSTLDSSGKVSYSPTMLKNLNKLNELGVFLGPASRKFGGFNLPRAVQLVVLEMLGQACPNTALAVAAYSYPDWIEQFGTQEQQEFYIPKVVSHTMRSAMALTEPQAGSDLGKLRTHAEKVGDHYQVNGTKRFISYGDADLVFTLVRTDSKSSGLEGLSVLIIPSEINEKKNLLVTKIEDKICLHASPTCELVFENSVGYLLGKEGKGFKVMAELMNRARLAMGAIAIGISVGALEESKKYASQRITMNKPIIQHPMVTDMIFEMEVETRAMRALALETASALDWLMIYRKKKDEQNIKKWKKRFRRLTPLVKYYCAEKTILMTKNALQVFGGYGVCRDYPVERLLREALIYPIYEGTSQIQSLMVLKDTLKDVSTHATGFLGSLAGAWAESLVSRDRMHSKLLQARNELNQSIRTILMSLIRGKFKSDIDSLREQKIQEFLRDFSLQLLSPKTDFTFPFLCAERLTRVVCDYYILKCMVDHYPPHDQEREKWILSFAEMALPRMRYENQIMSDRLPLTLDYLKGLPLT